MKHVLLDKDGQVHATILACPFKYKVPRTMSVYEDNPTMGQQPVDCFRFDHPVAKEITDMQARDFAVIRNGVIESVVVWGGAEWCPPKGTMIVPMEQWMGIGDSFDTRIDKFSINPVRFGKADKDKTLAELQAEADAVNEANLQAQALL